MQARLEVAVSKQRENLAEANATIESGKNEITIPVETPEEHP